LRRSLERRRIENGVVTWMLGKYFYIQSIKVFKNTNLKKSFLVLGWELLALFFWQPGVKGCLSCQGLNLEP